MNIYKDSEIKYLEGFLLEEELNKINYWINIAKWDHHKSYENPSDNWIDNIQLLLDPDLLNPIKNRIQSLFPNYFLEGPDVLQRTKINDDLVQHVDQIKNSDIAYGVVIYINDDFEGGETYYSEKNISFKPKKNTLIVHPGNQEYKHGVNKVISGSERIVLVAFLYNHPFIGRLQK
jgi:hypothetical protein